MVSAVVNKICLWAKQHVVGLSSSLPTIHFELGQLMKLTSKDELGDWKLKFKSMKEKFLVQQHLWCATVF